MHYFLRDISCVVANGHNYCNKSVDENLVTSQKVGAERKRWDDCQPDADIGNKDNTLDQLERCHH